jgi:hypothetical protein
MLRVDKKQRPYFRCESCGTMVFLRGGNQALRGPSLLWGPMNRAMQASDAAAAKVLLDRAVAENPERSAKEKFDESL